MYFADYHVHSDFSADGKDKLEEIVKEAIRKNLKEIAITEHYDYDLDGTAHYNKDFAVDIEKYEQELRKLQVKYAASIKVLFGLELGLQLHIKEHLSQIVKKYDFDFIIGSMHTLFQKDIYHFREEFFENNSKEEVYRLYFEEVLRSVKLFTDEFDVYGHLDFVMRYALEDDKSCHYADFRELLDQILRLLIQKGKGIEINTSGFRYGLGHMHPNTEIIKHYKELGGEIITVGSDAHHRKTLCSEFERAYAILKECGFSYITVFEKRKPRFVKI